MTIMEDAQSCEEYSKGGKRACFPRMCKHCHASPLVVSVGGQGGFLHTGRQATSIQISLTCTEGPGTEISRVLIVLDGESKLYPVTVICVRKDSILEQWRKSYLCLGLPVDLFACLLKMSLTFTTRRRHSKTLMEVNTDEGTNDNPVFVYIFAFSKLSKFYFHKQKKEIRLLKDMNFSEGEQSSFGPRTI